MGAGAEKNAAVRGSEPSSAALDSERTSSELGVDQAKWLAGILEHSSDIISILDLDGRILYINQTKPSTSPSKVIGRRAAEFLPCPVAQAWEEAFTLAVTLGAAQQVEVASVGDYWWETRLVPIRQGKQVSYVVSIGTDISERKRVQSALAVKEELLDLALEATRMGQWAWDIAGKTLIWDAQTSQMLGWSGPAHAGTLDSFLQLVHPEDRERVGLHLEQAARHGQLHAVEFRVPSAGGIERWLHLTGKAHFGRDGHPSDLLGGLLDVTRQRQSENAMHRAHKLEALGQLAAGVAHDFNNLLVAILGGVQLAQSATSPTEQQRLLEDAVTACLRAGELTRRLLAFGRPQAAVEQAIDLSTLLTDTLQLLQRLIPKQIEIDLQLADGLPCVLGDRGQLEQVVMNLCVNARDAMPAGGKLTISAARVPLGSEPPSSREQPNASNSGVPSRYGHYILLTVRDTGTGMSPEVAQRIFEPFFTTKEQGTGLGLPTVYSIVKQQGGTIDLISAPGEGTTFKVYLPTA